MNCLRKHWLACVYASLIGLSIGCGDDDADTASGAGESGGGGRAASSPRAGAGGRGGAGGRAAAGTGGVAEGGRTAAAGGGGRGGAAGSSSGGEDDAGVAGANYTPIARVGDKVYAQLNDLRGLKFAANGKIWASGHSDADASNRKLVLARFNSDGTLDTSFDSDGWVSYDAVPGANNDEQSLDLVELGNGDVIVAANISDQKGGAALSDTAGAADGTRGNGTDVVLIRFDSSGAPVTSWGTDGRALVKFGWDASADANWPAPLYTSSNMENQRYYRPGTGSDPTSNPPLAHSGYPSDSSWAVELDARDGIERLVVFGFGPAAVGGATQRYDNDRYIARILAETGTADPAFNGGAAFRFNSLSDENAFSDGGRRGFVETDGSIVAAGYTNYGSGLGNHVLLLRLKADGRPDDTFGFGFDPSRPGALRVNPFVTDMGVTECYQVGRQSNGRYITTGYGRATGMDVTSSTLGFQVTDGVDLVSVGIKADGTAIDTQYGKNGMIAIQSEMLGLAGTEDRGRDLVVLPDDRVVHAGRFGAGPAIFVTRPDGLLDESVGDDKSGRFGYEASAMTAGSHFYAIALSPDKKLIAASTSAAAEGARLAVLQVGASD